MRSLKPLCLTAAVALALAGTSALAATTTGISAAGASTSATTGTTSPSTTSGNTSGTTTGTTSTSGSTAVVGGCTGTNGSTCTATTSAQSNPSTANSTTTGSTLVTQQNTPPGISANMGNSGPATTTTTSSSPAQPTGTVNADPTFSRPGAFDPGGTFGPQAVPATTNTGVVEGGGVILPGSGTTGSQQNVFVQPPAQQSGVTVMNTPIFDQAARNGQAREARRRAAGDEPRVIGIAPRTERDLTWQMPDDPIIRY